MKRYIRMTGTGSSVPDKILRNTDLEKMLDTSDAWISEQTDIKGRRIAASEIIRTKARRISLPMVMVFVNIHKYGNTSAASIPIALDEAVREGHVKRGDKIMLVGFGAGFTWGSILIEW